MDKFGRCRVLHPNCTPAPEEPRKRAGPAASLAALPPAKTAGLTAGAGPCGTAKKRNMGPQKQSEKKPKQSEKKPKALTKVVGHDVAV